MFSRRKKIDPSFEAAAAPHKPLIRISYQPDTDLTIKNLTLTLPPQDGRPGPVLIENANLTIKKGDRIVLRGQRGCGKSTLLRAVAGLWEDGSGDIVRPSGASVLCIPQRPFLSNVTFNGILCYPDKAGYFSDEQLADALKMVGLEYMAWRLKDNEHDGSYLSSRFSPGEQQALIFARVFLRKPDILMLDEVTSSLDQESGLDLYRKLIEKLPDVTLISIVHRPELVSFHTIYAEIKNKTLTATPLPPPVPVSAPKPPTPEL